MTQQDQPPPSTPNGSLSPLSEVDPHSLDVLFAKDPTELSDSEIEKIVAKLEDDRLKFMANPETGAEPKKTRSPANLSKKIDMPTDISTEDLLGKIGL